MPTCCKKPKHYNKYYNNKYDSININTATKNNLTVVFFYSLIMTIINKLRGVPHSMYIGKRPCTTRCCLVKLFDFLFAPYTHERGKIRTIISEPLQWVQFFFFKFHKSYHRFSCGFHLMHLNWRSHHLYPWVISYPSVS